MGKITFIIPDELEKRVRVHVHKKGDLSFIGTCAFKEWVENFEMSLGETFETTDGFVTLQGVQGESYEKIKTLLVTCLKKEGAVVEDVG